MGRGRLVIHAIDLSDLFAFTSPENASHTVLVADVFPSAGASAMFSNVVVSLARGSPGDRSRTWQCFEVQVGRGGISFQLPI